MLTKKKSSGGGLGSSSTTPPALTAPTMSFADTTVNKRRAKSVGGATALTRVREEKVKVPIRSSFGGSNSSSTPAAPTTPNDILLAMVARVDSDLFSPDGNNVLKNKELKRLISCLACFDEIKDSTLLRLVEALKANVEHLDEKMSTLIHHVLDKSWCSRSPKVVNAVEDFMSELIVIKPLYVGSVIQSLIKKFLPLSNPLYPDEISPDDQKTFDIAHRMLEKVLNAFPRMKESCVKTMGAMYPYMGKAPHVHFCYLKNILQVTSYCPQLTSQVIHLCVHKLCRIDVHIPREDAEALGHLVSESDFADTIKSESGRVTSVKFDSEQLINSLICSCSSEASPLVNTMDLCLSLLLSCVASYARTLSPACTEPFWTSMLSCFEAEVLPTFGINHIQFVFFYLVSEHSNFGRKFLEFLWARTVNVNTSPVIRVQCMSYIAGVLSRSSFSSIKILKRWLTKMSTWANNYVEQRNGSMTHWSCVNVHMHAPFYAVCQTIFYIFAFRNKDLINNRKCIAFTSTLNLGTLVTCNLNPLKAIIPRVAVAFVQAAHYHEISYCQTVLERNQRATIPTAVRDSVSASDSAVTLSDTLEAFFPFDPYHLPRSRKWVDGWYRVFEPYLPQVKIEKEETQSDARGSDSVDNEDSIDMELSCSFKEKDNFMDTLISCAAEDMEED